MAIYVDLQPPPQFDKSLITYVVTNFGRVKDALAVAQRRNAIDSGVMVGPWPRTQSITTPFFKQDVLLWSSLTYYCNAGPGFMIAMIMTFDGADVGPLSEQYFNEGNSKKTMSSAGIIRGVAKGAHTISMRAITGGVASDADDRCHLQLTYYEL